MPLRQSICAVTAGLLLSLAAAAEVKQASPDGFVLEHRFAITASPTVAWEVLVHPERYWPDGHTWSGRAANLSLAPEAGGCFCERWAQGSAEHGRVIMAHARQAAAVPRRARPVPGHGRDRRDDRDPGPERVGHGGGRHLPASTATASQRLGDMAAVVDSVVRQQFAGFAALASRPRNDLPHLRQRHAMIRPC